MQHESSAEYRQGGAPRPSPHEIVTDETKDPISIAPVKLVEDLTLRKEAFRPREILTVNQTTALVSVVPLTVVDNLTSREGISPHGIVTVDETKELVRLALMI